MRDDLWEEFLIKRHAEIARQRKAKMVDLARHLGIQFEHLDLSSYPDLAAFYACIADNFGYALDPWLSGNEAREMAP